MIFSESGLGLGYWNTSDVMLMLMPNPASEEGWKPKGLGEMAIILSAVGFNIR